ncbi:MAG: PH domain-containing protein [Hymenobacteraceae bacterium]|nr:PH domain-containing protein [Hymenobacteraceae bacterium]
MILAGYGSIVLGAVVITGILLNIKGFSFLHLIPLLLIAALFLWILHNTAYTISGDKLIYKSAFLKGSIDIHSIKKIEKNKTMWAGLKPVLATKGLIIHYLDGVVGEDIYFSPENKNVFVEELLQINPEIEVVEQAEKQRV